MKITKYEQWCEDGGWDEIGFVAINESESMEFEPIKRPTKLPAIGSALTIEGEEYKNFCGTWTVLGTSVKNGRVSVQLKRWNNQAKL